MIDVRSRQAWFVVAALAAAAFVLTLVATRHGPGVSPDSVSYLAAARNAAHGHGFTDFDGSPLSYWPPGLPAVLAVFDVIGVRGVDAARVVNAFMMAGAVVLSYLLLRRHVQSGWIVLFGTALVACSPAILRTTDMVWAEPLFTVLVLAFVLLLEDACRSGRYFVLAAAGVVASAAILVKYLGFALVAAGVLALAVAFLRDDTQRDDRVRRAVAKVGWFAFWGLVGPAAWGIRNLNEGEPLFGRRTGLSESLATVAADELEGVGRLFVPDGVPRALSIVVGLLVAAVVVTAVVIVFRDRATGGIVPLVLVTAGSFGAAFVSRVGASIGLSARVLSPVYVPVVVLALWLFEYVRVRAGGQTARFLLNGVAGLAIVGLAAFVVWSAALAWSHGRHGQGYASPSFASSELIGAVGRLPSTARVYSNDPLAVAYVAGRLPVGLALTPGQQNAIGRRSASEAELERLACAHPVHLAWFGSNLDVPASLGDSDTVNDGVLINVACRS